MTQTVPLAHLASAKPTAAESSSRKTLNGLALAVAKAKRIVVVTGAGISCSSGIPDFRSSDGLYNLVKARYPDVVLKGRDLFDAALFRDPMSAAVFYTFMAELKTQIDSARPAPVHDFLAMLDAKGKLLRSYTQNIDGLEERAGLSQELDGSAVPRAKNVQLHGDIHRVRCTLCSASFPCAPDHIAQFRTGVPPDCPECIARSDARTARSARALKCGTLRPAIVLYDEPHPLGDHIGAVQTSDLGKKPDLLIIMGTSLKVHGLRRLVKEFAKAVHSSRPDAKSGSRSLLHSVLFVNRTPPPPGEWAGVLDYHVEGDADAWVAQVLAEWKRARPVDWEIQSTLDGMGNVPRGLCGGIKGKKAVKSKGKSKAGTENMPPEETDSGKPGRFTIVIPRRIGLSKSPLKARTGKLVLGKPRIIGLPRSPGLRTPVTPLKPGTKRPAGSPLVAGQARLDAIFPRSPAPAAKRPAWSPKVVCRSAMAVPDRPPGDSASSSVPSTSAPSTLSSTPSSSALSLLAPKAPSPAPSSQASRTSTQDSIFSQGSQSTLDSSQESQDDGSDSQMAVAGSPKPCHTSPSHYPRPPLQSGSGKPWSRSASQYLPDARRTSSATGRPFARYSSTGSIFNARVATRIPIPGRDFGVSATGERFPLCASDSEDDAPPASQVSITAPPPGPPLPVEPALDSDSEAEPPRGLLFKGKEAEDMNVDVIDLDPTDDEDYMSLDGAVEHMSLGPVRDVDTDVDVVGISSGDDTPMLPVPSVASPVQTRARRRAKEAATKRPKRVARPRVAGTRTSSRLAAMTGT